MGSVAAHSDKYGEVQVQLSSMPWTGRIDVGDYYTAPEAGSSTHLVAWQYRAGKSSNPIREDGTRANSSYRRAIARGTPIAGAHEARYPPFVFVRRGHASDTYDARADLNTYPLSMGYESLSENEEATAITAALGKLADDKMSLSTYMAEAVKSADMIAGTAIDLFSGLIAFKRGRGFPKHLRRKFRPSPSDVSSGYLQYQYGWRPLCSDLYNMYEGFGERDHRKMKLFGKATVSSTYADSEDTQWWTQREQNCKVTGRCAIYANVDSELFRQANQFGLVNPLTLGWELIPYSFVVDWAMPIGNFLEGLTAGVGLTFHSAYSSTTIEGSVFGRRRGGPEIEGLLNGIQYRFKSTDRKAYQSYPFPQVYHKSPFSTSNVTSALALWHQLVGR